MSSPTRITRTKSSHSTAFHSCISGDFGDAVEEEAAPEDSTALLESTAIWAKENPRNAAPGYGTEPNKVNEAPVVFNNISVPNPFGGHLLLNVSGVLLAGKITAILGSDETEVTALVTALAGALDDEQYTGTVYYNQVPIGPWYRKSVVGFARMNGVFVSRSLTVRQNLVFSLQLHLQVSKTEMNKTVDRVLDLVGLASRESERVNDLDQDGKLRLTIAQELLLDPAVLIVESPTSGMGYSASLAIMQMLSRLAEMGKTVVVTLYQPRWKVYNIVDNLLLIHGGRMAYFGKAGEEAIEFFQSRGMIWSRNYTPTDFLLQLCKTEEAGWTESAEDTPQMDSVSLEAEFLQSAEYQTGLFPYLKDIAKEDFGQGGEGYGMAYKEPTELKRLCILLKSIAMRQWAHKAWNAARIILTVLLVVGMCKLYEFQTSDQAGLQNRVGITFFTVIVLMLVNIPAASTLIRHRPVFLHLRSSGCYTTFTYWLCCLVWELLVVRLLSTLFFAATAFRFFSFEGSGGASTLAGLIAFTQTAFFSLAFTVGSLASTASTAATVLEALFAFFIVTGGLLINSKGIPSWLEWVQNLSYFRYCYESILVDMFHGNSFGCDATPSPSPSQGAVGANMQCFTGDSYLSLQGFDVDDKWTNMYILMAISAVLLLISLAGLWLMKPPLVLPRPSATWYNALIDGLRSLWGKASGELPSKIQKNWKKKTRDA